MGLPGLVDPHTPRSTGAMHHVSASVDATEVGKSEQSLHVWAGLRGVCRTTFSLALALRRPQPRSSPHPCLRDEGAAVEAMWVERHNKQRGTGHAALSHYKGYTAWLGPSQTSPCENRAAPHTGWEVE